MTFFYDLNKKLQQVLEMPKSEHQQLNEGAAPAVAEASTSDYSAKKARAGKDIGKPGKNFEKIAKSAGERYGSKAAGERVAGAVLAKLRGKANEGEIPKHLQGAKKSEVPAFKRSPLTLQDLEHEQDRNISHADTLKKVHSGKPLGKIGKSDLPEGAKNDDDDDDWWGDKEKKSQKTALGGTVTRHGKITRHQAAPGRYGGYDPETDPDKDDEATEKGSGEKRGRGRPKKTNKAPERVTGKAWKHKGGRKMSKEEIEETIAALEECGYSVTPLEEKAVSKAQQRFMGMVHAAQKGEEPASKEVAKVAKSMKKSDAEDFAKTKHKGLPEKKAKKKDESVEENTTEAPKAKGGVQFGKGIYDSMNHELETMIAESMNISLNMNNADGGSRSLTVSATDEDADKLAALLKMAGMDNDHDDACPACGNAQCNCAEQVDENQPDWPTNTETSNDALQYSGGINKPKSTGQTVNAPFNRQDSRQGVMSEDEEIRRMMEMAGIQEANHHKGDEEVAEGEVCPACKSKSCHCEDMDEGNLFTGNLAKARAAHKKEADLDGDGDLEKVRESLQTLWKNYKG